MRVYRHCADAALAERDRNGSSSGSWSSFMWECAIGPIGSMPAERTDSITLRCLASSRYHKNYAIAGGIPTGFAKLDCAELRRLAEVGGKRA